MLQFALPSPLSVPVPTAVRHGSAFLHHCQLSKLTPQLQHMRLLQLPGCYSSLELQQRSHQSSVGESSSPRQLQYRSGFIKASLKANVRRWEWGQCFLNLSLFLRPFTKINQQFLCKANSIFNLSKNVWENLSSLLLQQDIYEGICRNSNGPFKPHRRRNKYWLKWKQRYQGD